MGSEVVQNITLTNTSTVPIVGPIALLFENLTPGVFLDNGNLMSICQSPGTQLISVDFKNLPPGKQVTATAHFVVGTTTPIEYQPVVLAGQQIR